MAIFYRKNQCVIFDVKTLNVTYYENGSPRSWRMTNKTEFVMWCRESLDAGICVILLRSNQSDKLFYDLEYYGFNVCCYNIDLPMSSNHTNVNQNSINDVLNVVNEVKALLVNAQPKNANYTSFNTLSPNIKEQKSFFAESLEALDKKLSETQYLVSEIYNNHVSGASSNGSSKIIDDLRNELAAYKNDFYQKSMLHFGVNFAIDILERLYNEKNLLKQKEDAANELNRLEQIISFCESKMKKLNLKVNHSTDGDEFDGSRMVTYTDKVSTDNKDLKGRVAYSISPAVYWTLPRVNTPEEDKLLIKEEIVALYE